MPQLSIEKMAKKMSELPVNQIICGKDIKEICFAQDTVERKKFFKFISFSHPAKMILGLQIYLIEHYTKPGETILDPMAGSGTILMACTLGRNVICVELEQKFVAMQQANWQKIKAMGPMLGCKMGEAVILQGDARNLAGLLADKCIFSPPYAEAHDGKNLGVGDTDHPDLRNRSWLKTDNPNQIGNLPYGEISTVISSPPYGLGEGLGHSEKKRSKLRKEKYRSTTYTDKVDSIISSPPYEASITGKNGIDWTKLKGERDRTKEPAFDRYAMNNFAYSNQQTNIGNLTSENYLAQMFLVYCNCYSVLRNKGLMCLVTKNFIRKKKIVQLDIDTIKLCESAGFILKERLKRKLTQQSFWRTIYYKKYPNVPKIEHEDILIFEKGQQALFPVKA